MQTAAVFLLPLVLLGHIAFCVLVFNRLHALRLSCKIIRKIEKVIFLCVVVVPAAYLWGFGFNIEWLCRLGSHPTWLMPTLAYVVICLLALLFVTTMWMSRRINNHPPDQLLANHTRVFDVAEQIGRLPVGHGGSAFLGKIPGNQTFQLAVNEKVLCLPRLSPRLEGLSIAHISDLHYTGRITKDFFQAVVDHVNALDADVIAITGDIIDKEACLPWIDETLGRLTCRQGKFFVLGNHDKRIKDVDGLRVRLQDCGIVDLGGRWMFQELMGERVLLAGNELPWFGTRGQLRRGCPSEIPDDTFRILLAHTPDQIPWARSMSFDLMLAGHTHGGQVRFPVIGPVASPSKHGVKYAGGLFYEPPTLMHVSRGISALHPIRINCLPELTKLVLTRSVS